MAEAGSPAARRARAMIGWSRPSTAPRPATRSIRSWSTRCTRCAPSSRPSRACSILTGAGGVFASGADIAQLRERRAEDARRGINTTAFRRIRTLPMPVIAAIDGWALGGGAELAYAADIRIATPAAKIGNPETGLGIIAAAGATWRLPEIVGHARASELLLTGRILTADEALAWGLVSSLHAADDLLAAAHAIADRIAANDPLATRHTKTALLAPRRRASRDRARTAGRALREPREDASHDRVPREAAPMSAVRRRDASPPRPPASACSAADAWARASRTRSCSRAVASRSSSATIRRRMPRPPASARVSPARCSAAPRRCTLDELERALESRHRRRRRSPRATSSSRRFPRTVRSRSTRSPASKRCCRRRAVARLEHLVDLDRRPRRRAAPARPGSSACTSSTRCRPRRSSRSSSARATAPELVDDARSWVAAIGKTPVVVRDAPGFASSRLGVALGARGDPHARGGRRAAPKTSTRRWSWGTGIRWVRCARPTSSGSTCASASPRSCTRKLGERFAPPELLRRLVAEGHLGRKTGRGFYEWSE